MAVFLRESFLGIQASLICPFSFSSIVDVRTADEFKIGTAQFESKSGVLSQKRLLLMETVRTPSHVLIHMLIDENIGRVV